jgi:hypothetical protein
MDEQTVRTLVRQVLARHANEAAANAAPTILPLMTHASHYRYLLPESDGPCIIEPSVQCNHCGYCESHGH